MDSTHQKLDSLQLNYRLNFYYLKIMNKLINIIIEMNLFRNIIIGWKKFKNIKKKLPC